MASMKESQGVLPSSGKILGVNGSLTFTCRLLISGSIPNLYLGGGGFKYSLFTPNLGKMIQID